MNLKTIKKRLCMWAKKFANVAKSKMNRAKQITKDFNNLQG
jgi:hypothetical protein